MTPRAASSSGLGCPPLSPLTPPSPPRSLVRRLLARRHAYASAELERAYEGVVYPGERASLRALLVLLLALALTLAVTDLLLGGARVSVESGGCVTVCLLGVCALVFLHTRCMAPHRLHAVRLFSAPLSRVYAPL